MGGMIIAGRLREAMARHRTYFATAWHERPLHEHMATVRGLNAEIGTAYNQGSDALGLILGMVDGRKIGVDRMIGLLEAENA